MEMEKKEDELNFLNYQLKTTINIHNHSVTIVLILKDSRFASSSGDKSIKIFNRITYEIDIVINEHTHYASHITQLRDERLVSASSDNTIKIFTLFEKSYQVDQVITEHSNRLRKTIELNNNYLVSCSWDKTIKIWNKNENNLYELKQNIVEENEIDSVFELNDSEIFSLSFFEKKLIFYKLNNDNLFEREKSIDNTTFSGFVNNFVKLNDNTFLIGGPLRIYSIDIPTHRIKKTYIFEEEVYSIYFFQNLYLSKDGYLFVGCETDIIQFKVSEDNIKLIVQVEGVHEENVHENWRVISCIFEDVNGDIITSSYDGTIKIWSPKNKKIEKSLDTPEINK